MNDHVRIIKAMTWAQNRLADCERTRREARNNQSRDWAYGESVALRAMLQILDTGRIPGENLDAGLDASPSASREKSSK